tara:strand:- start:317 stop:805 length:489 start_codon:yes stop_codon:yes gene_type:complete
MGHSLNNPNKEQFIKRTGSYSTHGSRRGFVDDGIKVESNDENRQALVHKLMLNNKIITDFRKKYRIASKKRIALLPYLGKTRSRIPEDEYNRICDLIKLKKDLEQEIKKYKKPKGKNVPKKTHAIMVEIYKEKFGREINEAIYLEALKRRAILMQKKEDGQD